MCLNWLVLASPSLVLRSASVSRSAAPPLTAPGGSPSLDNPALSQVLSLSCRSCSAYSGSVLRCSSALSRASSRRWFQVISSRLRSALPSAPKVFLRSRPILQIAPQLCPAICCSLQPRIFLSVLADWCSPSPSLVLRSLSVPRPAVLPLPAPCRFPSLGNPARSQKLSLSWRSCSAYSGSVLRCSSALSQASSFSSFQVVPSRTRSELPLCGSVQPASRGPLAFLIARSCPGRTPVGSGSSGSLALVVPRVVFCLGPVPRCF